MIRAPQLGIKQWADTVHLRAAQRELELIADVAGPDQCPWCGSAEQYTDPLGTCARCRLPWDHEDWLSHHHERHKTLLQEENRWR